jgi:hypothetical protein
MAASSIKIPAITSLSNFTESINGLVYADPGAGKTVLGGTANNALILATEAGTISAKRSGSSARVVKVPTWNVFEEIVRRARRGDERFLKPDWWIIDTLTEAQNLLMRQILEDAHEENKSRGIDTPQIQDWGVYQNRFKRVVKAINDLPVNVLYLCHTMTDEDEEGNQVVLPAIQGKNGTNDPLTMSRWVCGTVHFYGYLKVKHNGENEFRRLICKRSGPYFGKDRYGVLLPYIDDPNMVDIEKRIVDSMPDKEGKLSA